MTDALRRLTIFGIAGGAVFAVPQLPALGDWLIDDFDFTEIDRPAGFRRIGFAGQSSGIQQFFASFDEPDARDVAAREAVAANLCAQLHHPTEAVPVAIFSDYYCPNCHVLDERLLKIESEGLIRLRWHETPIFGARSVFAARAAIAARAQGIGTAYKARVTGSPIQLNAAYLADVVTDLGADPDQFAADMDAASTDQELRLSSAVAQTFGFVGTPSLVVGRTLVQGALSDTNLRQLIAREDAERRDWPCTGSAA